MRKNSGFSSAFNILLLAIVIAAVATTTLAVKHNQTNQVPRAASSNPETFTLQQLNELGLEIDQNNCPGGYKMKGLKTPTKSFFCTHGPDKLPMQNPSANLNEIEASKPLTTESMTVPCFGNGSDGNRVQILYVRASDIPDHSGWADSFKSWAKSGNDIFIDSAAQTGGYRSMKFVHDANCIPTVQNVVINPEEDLNASTISQALSNRGFTNPNRKYLIFADIQTILYCGQSPVDDDDRKTELNLNNSGPTYSFVYGDCWNEKPPNLTQEGVAHEMAHSFGAVQLSAPNSSGDDHHCTDNFDIMCGGPLVCPDESQERRFDCNKNDYFSTNPDPSNYLYSHWNIADSSFLMKSPPSMPTPTPSTPPPSGQLKVYIRDKSTGQKFNKNVTVRALYMNDCPQGCPGPSGNTCGNPVCTGGRNQLYTPSNCSGSGCALWQNYNQGKGYFLSVCSDCTDSGTTNLPSNYEITRLGCGSSTALFYPSSGGASCTIEVGPSSKKAVTVLKGYIFHDDERQPNYPNARKNDEQFEASIPGVTLSVKGYKSTVSGENSGSYNYKFNKIPAGSYKFNAPVIPSEYMLIPCNRITKPIKIPGGNSYFYCQNAGKLRLKKWDTSSSKGWTPTGNNKSYGSIGVPLNQTTTVDFPLLNNTSGSNALLPDAD